MKESQDLGFAMKMRKLPLFRLCARLLAGLLAIGVVSSSLVWCHESDGRVSVEHIGRCWGYLSVSQPTSDDVSLSSHSSDSCDSCVDVRIFTFGPNSSSPEALLSLHGAAVALIESAPSPISSLQALIASSLNAYQTNLALISSVRSAVLLI